MRREAVPSIRGIGVVVGEIEQISTAVAAAVEQQGSATREIARNVAEAAPGTSEVSGNISAVTDELGEARDAARQLRGNADGVATQGEELRRSLAGLPTRLRA